MFQFQRCLFYLLILLIANGFTQIKGERGEVWPKPQYIVQLPKTVNLPSQNFKFVYQGKNCPLLQDAFVRYYALIFNPPRLPGAGQNWGGNVWVQFRMKGTLSSLKITMHGKCESIPYHGMDESYSIRVDAHSPPSAQLTANSTWGILRGLETFSQLVYHNNSEPVKFAINSTIIFDYPRFPFRGFLLDTSRHFINVNTIKNQLDAMAYNKFNVLHWHITDDQSFPYVSHKYPSLSNKSAFAIRLLYERDDVDQIINYAAERGIRVIPEFDTPGHTESWGRGARNLLTPCYNSAGKPDGSYGPINPSLASTYDFLRKFFTETKRIFFDKFFHLGGDEVDFSCWESNPFIKEFMKKMRFGNDYAKLEHYYMNQLFHIISKYPNSKRYIVWQDVFDSGNINKNAVVHVWRPDLYKSELAKVTAKGHQAILSSCWYLDHQGNTKIDWVNYYNCEPLDFYGDDKQYKLVIGGTGCMWGEYVDQTNLIPKAWPRALAIAERLWSARNVNNVEKAIPRFEEQRCRMTERNINVEPGNGPSYCIADYLPYVY
ncbi:hypothetical protein CHUAL_006933 [Chamberlinius hualienensis]